MGTILLKTPPELSVAQTMQGTLIFTRNEEIDPKGRTYNQFGAWFASNGKSKLLSKSERIAWSKQHYDVTEEDLLALLGKSERITQKVDTVYCWSFLIHNAETDQPEWIDCDRLFSEARVGMRFLLKCTKEMTVVASYSTSGILYVRDNFNNVFSLLHLRKEPFARMQVAQEHFARKYKV